MSFGVRGKRREMEVAAAGGADSTAKDASAVSGTDSSVDASAVSGTGDATAATTGAAAVEQMGEGKEGGGKGSEGREAKKSRVEADA